MGLPPLFPFQNGVFIHRVRTLSLSRVQDRYYRVEIYLYISQKYHKTILYIPGKRRNNFNENNAELAIHPLKLWLMIFIVSNLAAAKNDMYVCNFYALGKLVYFN
jgi:hypothetical protein